MPLHTHLDSAFTEVDIIIAGGGTAGCIVAARLADADPQLSVLVVEHGPDNNLASITYPVFFIKNLMPDSPATIFYKGHKAGELADREPIVPSGGVLGGGSSINLMTYSRAQRSDFDSWNAQGWSSEELLPYMKKLETYHGQGDDKTHGFEGPIQVSTGRFGSPHVTNDFLAAGAAVGYPEVEDIFNLDTNNAMQRTLRYISPEGKRQDTASCYIHPRLQDGKHPNLHVLLSTDVLRVVIENQRAVGVETKSREIVQNNDGAPEHSIRFIKARKMVIVSCGALGTPLVLERSGVGNPDILNRAGVSVVAEVPGVGEGYNDHQLLIYPYRSSLLPEETLDSLSGGRTNPEELVMRNDPMLDWNGQEVTSRIRPRDEEITALGPKCEEAWKRSFSPFLDRPLAHLTLITGFTEDPSLVPVGQYFSVTAFTTYPESRGHMHITGPGLADAIDFKPGFFSDPDQVDIKHHVWVYKKQREIVRRMATYRGEVAIGHPRFAATSAAACVEIEEPLTGVQDLVYTPEDDAVIEQWLREKVGTTWHSLGTCKMAPLSDLGVVDGKLSVHGVEALKIADLSIPPSNVAANTNNTALVIGEKAADIIIDELALGK